MAILTELTLAQAISTDDCKAAYAESGNLVTPCGLEMDYYEIPGIFWSAIQHVHQKHHDDGRPNGPWYLLETVSQDGPAVTVTFSEG